MTTKLNVLKEEIEKLKNALNEFANDDNWLIESEYIDRPIKTYSSDWIYIGQWDPRVFSSYAIAGEPLENTNPEKRKKLSDFYKPCKHTVEIEVLKKKLEIAEESLTSIASLSRPRHIYKDYWLEVGVENCAECLAEDTRIAREALKQIDEIGK